MKIIRRICEVLICLFCVAVLLVGTAGYYFGDTIKAIMLTMNYSEEELGRMLDETYSEVNGFLEENPQYLVRPSERIEEKLHGDKIITDEELADILKGITSVSELFGAKLEVDEKNNVINSETGEKLSNEQITEMKKSNEPQNPGGSDPSSPGTQTPSDVTEDTGGNAQKNADKISACIAEMYVLKSSFTSSLDTLYQDAISRYNSLPPSQRESGKNVIIDELYPKAAALEKQCDSKVKEVTNELTKLLKEDGQSLDLVEKIKTAYYQEKSVRKAMYMEKL